MQGFSKSGMQSALGASEWIADQKTLLCDGKSLNRFFK